MDGRVGYRRLRSDRERGAAAVELAIILPVLAMLFFGIFEFGRGYNARIQLTAAVREGARYAAIHDTATLPDVQQKTRDAASGLNPGSIIVTWDECDTAASPPVLDTAVHASYPFTFSIPFFSNASITLEATGVMRCGG